MNKISIKEKETLLGLRKKFQKISKISEIDNKLKKEFEIFFELYDKYALNGIYFLIRTNKTKNLEKNLSIFSGNQGYIQTTFWSYLNKNNKEIGYPSEGNGNKTSPLGFIYLFNEQEYYFEIAFRTENPESKIMNYFKSIITNTGISFEEKKNKSPIEIYYKTKNYNFFNELDLFRVKINNFNNSNIIKPISYEKFVNNLNNKLDIILESQIEIIKNFKSTNYPTKKVLKRFFEGEKKQFLHEYKERNPKLIKEAKAIFKRKFGKLFCEVCNFSFEEKYGKEYIEGHHKNPISELTEKTEMKIEHISLLCPNCHRMIHNFNKNKILTIEELKYITELWDLLLLLSKFVILMPFYRDRIAT